MKQEQQRRPSPTEPPVVQESHNDCDYVIFLKVFLIALVEAATAVAIAMPLSISFQYSLCKYMFYYGILSYLTHILLKKRRSVPSFFLSFVSKLDKNSQLISLLCTLRWRLGLFAYQSSVSIIVSILRLESIRISLHWLIRNVSS